ncbi:hypothetical protein GSI_08444 [Ganoderma sinense ZZ0214-1]|uniref:Integrase catalytic domain-containing protein n=1 Tax=Ganoderma sinense ZZ0214-1 TaxID=1077348 RepID=A0A2G8S3Q8_9APHY|nr:hypothetical protein GSI_08444 [Ganoderma sinense ZZ0214-1]
MDMIVKLPDSHGYDSIWVVCDRLTRYAHFVPCNEAMDAPALAWLFFDRIFRHHGMPESIVSDRGTTFVSQFWNALTSLLRTELKFSTAHHPQTDGLTERTNQTLECYLRAYVSSQQDDWVDYLPLAEFAFNNHASLSTGKSPFFANLGYHPTFNPLITPTATVPAANDMAQRLSRLHVELQAQLRATQNTQSRYYNEHVKDAPKFKPGQLVWLLRRHIKSIRPSDKLDHRRLGPFPIHHPISDVAYKLQLPTYLSRLHPVFHVSLLEPYYDTTAPLPHSNPVPFPISEDSPAPAIHAILDCRKLGQRYEYLVHWRDLPQDEDSWVPITDIPSTANELLERFHRRHTRAPRPPTSLLLRPSNPEPHTSTPSAFSNANNSSAPPMSSVQVPPPALSTSSAPAKPSSSEAVPTAPPAMPSVPHAAPRTPSPKPRRVDPRVWYEPPAETTTRSKRVVHPPDRLNL